MTRKKPLRTRGDGRTQKTGPNRYGKIFLVGFMGSGKTTVGRLLSRSLGFPFADLDALIVRRTRHSIPDLFMARGEAGFRRIETESLRKICLRPGPLIAATGGGVVTRKTNITLMRRHGLLLHLRITPATALKRLAGDSARPLLAGLTPEEKITKIRSLMRKRAPLYSLSHISMKADAPLRTVASVADKKIRCFFRRQGL